MKIFFLTPFGGRTGSEMMLQYAIEKAGTNIEPIVFSRTKGSFFAKKFKKDYFFMPKKSDFIGNILNGFYFKFFKKTLEQNFVDKINNDLNPDFWYLNTITLTDHAKTAILLNVPYVVHVHELLGSFDEHKIDDFHNMMLQAKLIICCSFTVQKTINQMGYTQTVLIHSCVDFEQIKITQKAEDLRVELGFLPTDFVWAMSGTMSMRKGYDLVPEILAKLPKNHHLIWLGGKRDTALEKYVSERCKSEKLNFHFLGEKSVDYYDYLNAIDGFSLLSREDPFPLVMIESAFLGKPIVAFDSGGVKEFVQNGMGKVTEGLNIDALVEAMIEVADNKIEVSKVILRNRAMQFNAQIISDLWLENLKKKMI
jgi:L-malate glycosyltransferase